MKRHTGFTLIELIVVIAVLGILAANTVPVFMNPQADARASALNDIKSSLKSGVSMVYSKAILSGLENSAYGAELCMDKVAGAVGTDCDMVSLVYGRPAATADGVVKIVQNEVCASTDTVCDKDGTYSLESSEIRIYSSIAPDMEGCSVSYKEATASTPPSITSNYEGC
jgi:MSHA pilin protein MshA